MGNKGRHWKLSDISKKHIGDAVRGRKLSDETKKKISEGNKLAYKKGKKKLFGKDNHFFGKTWTSEHRAKIKKAREKIKVSWSPEKIERIKKRYEILNSPHPVCQKCGQIIRRHNQTDMCRKHRNFSKKVKEKAKIKYQENIEERRKKENAYAARPEVKKQKQIYDIKYRQLNGKRIDNRIKIWRKKRKQTDILFKLKLLLQCRINNIYRRIKFKKKNRTVELVGCDLQLLKKYLENQFKEGMSWQNHGKWHIDHIIPLGIAKSEEELIKLCHYTNLQPLWAEENLRKSKKHII